MATSINAIGGVSGNGYPGPIIQPSDSAYGSIYGSNATDEATGLGESTTPLNPYDLNGDGTVTPQEYQQALDESATALPTTTFAALSAAQDADGDGIPDASDPNDFAPQQAGNFTTQLNTPENNGGFFGENFGPFDARSNAFQNSVLGNLATQAYGAVSAAAIDESPRQQSLSLFA